MVYYSSNTDRRAGASVFRNKKGRHGCPQRPFDEMRDPLYQKKS